MLDAQGAGPAEYAHHVEQSAVPGDEDAIRLLLEAGAATAPRAPAAAAHWFRAALRLLPTGDAARQVDVPALVVFMNKIDLANKKISIRSPVAQALLGKAEGDSAVVQRPKGPAEVTVVKVWYEASAR